MKFSIRKKIAMVFLLIVFFFSTISIYLLDQSKKSLKESIGNSTVLIAESRLNSIIRSIDKISFIIKSNSNSKSVKDFIKRSNASFSSIKNIPAYLLKTEEELQSGKPGTIPVIKKITDNSVTRHFKNEIIDYFENRYGYPIINDIVITNRYGATVAAAKKFIDYNQTEEDWWSENTGRDLFVMNYKRDSHTGNYGINVVIRIKDKKNRFIGTLKSLVNINGIVRETDLSMRKYGSTYTGLLSQDGKLIYSTQTFTPNEDYTKKDIYKSFTDTSGFFTRHRRIGNHLISYAKSGLNKERIGNGWIIFVSHDLEEVLEPVSLLKKQFLLLLLLFLIIGSIIAYWNTRIITKPLLSLVNDIDIIGRGDLKHRVKIYSNDEFSFLGERFNNMLLNMEQTVIALETSNRDLEQFAYVASHDLQEPLRMVSSYLELIKQRYFNRLDKDADEFIEFAVDGAHRMKFLINDLLVFSRVATRGKPFLSHDLNDLVAITLKNLKLKIEENHAAITCDPLPEIYVDDTQFIQLVQNLIGNAIKFRSHRDPVIRLSAQEKGNEWEFSVKDNGIGIDRQFSDKIFIIFQRLHTRGEYPGTGIGLAICKKIVERHWGRIWFHSSPGEGTTFYFTINKFLHLYNIQDNKEEQSIALYGS